MLSKKQSRINREHETIHMKFKAILYIPHTCKHAITQSIKSCSRTANTDFKIQLFQEYKENIRLERGKTERYKQYLYNLFLKKYLERMWQKSKIS